MNRLMVILIPGTALIAGLSAYLVGSLLGDDRTVAAVNGAVWAVGTGVMLTWRHLRTRKQPSRNGET